MQGIIKTYSFQAPTARTVLTLRSTPTAVRPIVPGSTAPQIEESEPKVRVSRISHAKRRHK